MPHRFVWNVRDLEPLMCGQHSLGARNLGSFESKIKDEEVCVCVCVLVIVGV